MKQLIVSLRCKLWWVPHLPVCVCVSACACMCACVWTAYEGEDLCVVTPPVQGEQRGGGVLFISMMESWSAAWQAGSHWDWCVFSLVSQLTLDSVFILVCATVVFLIPTKTLDIQCEIGDALVWLISVWILVFFFLACPVKQHWWLV